MTVMHNRRKKGIKRFCRGQGEGDMSVLFVLFYGREIRRKLRVATDLAKIRTSSIGT